MLLQAPFVTLWAGLNFLIYSLFAKMTMIRLCDHGDFIQHALVPAENKQNLVLSVPPHLLTPVPAFIGNSPSHKPL